MVYVISNNGQPLMPTSRCGKVYRLLKDGKAKVIKRCPFTIKLLYDTTNYVQDLSLGVDTGSGTLATAVSDQPGNIYYMSEVIVRNDIASKMTDRSKYRRARRSRKLRYRQPRWANRKNSIKKDRFSPTMISKINSHIREIEFVKSILPIKQLIIETGKFDTTLLDHQGEDFNCHYGYQKGPAYGYKNNHEAVLNRDNYTCQCCKSKKGTMHAHHITYRTNNGSDKMDNLITLCESCHKKVHNGELDLKLNGKKKGTIKFATQMNSIRIQLLKHYPDAIETFGFITKANREFSNLPKEHYIDACVISTGGKKINFKTDLIHIKKSISKGDYQRTRGIRSEQKLPSGKIHGFFRYDKVQYLGKEYFIKGRMSSGYTTLMDINGITQKFENPKTVKLSQCKRINSRKTWIITKEKIITNLT